MTSALLKIAVRTSSGYLFELNAESSTTVDQLKNSIAKTLNLPAKHFVLVHQSRVITGGTVSENNIANGSEVMILLIMQSGRRTSRIDNPTISKIVEKLSDSQVRSFLGGNSPLSLKLHFGDTSAVVTIQINDSVANSVDKCNTLSSPTASKTNLDMLHFQEPSMKHRLDPKPDSEQSKLASSESRRNSVYKQELAVNITEDKLVIPLIDLGDTKLAVRNLTEFMENVYRKSLPLKEISSNAYIETIANTGDGIFNGTFSGTLLTPIHWKHMQQASTRILALIQILRDLLLLSPHCHDFIQNNLAQNCQKPIEVDPETARKRCHTSDQNNPMTKMKSMKKPSLDQHYKLRQTVTSRNNSTTVNLTEHSADLRDNSKNKLVN